jgi:hypothetical protein
MLLSRYFKPTNQDHLELFNQISKNLSEELLGREPKIAWYPSSGFDTQDVIRLQQEDPDIYFHTDTFFGTDINNINQFFSEGLIDMIQYGIGDGIILRRIDVNDPIIDLRFRRRLKFIKDPNDRRAYLFRGAYLFNVQITYSIGTEPTIIIKPIIYFIMDDINFFDEFILKNNIRICYLVRKRQGERNLNNHRDISLSILFPFLGQIGVQCLLLDCDARDSRRNVFSDEEKILIQCLCYKYGYFLYPNLGLRRKSYILVQDSMQIWEDRVAHYIPGIPDSGIVFKYNFNIDIESFKEDSLKEYINHIHVENGLFQIL